MIFLKIFLLLLLIILALIYLKKYFAGGKCNIKCIDLTNKNIIITGIDKNNI